uniref:Coronin n=1 Tax=Fibrocapsa japonica TaxID=94617 RepID=A0A7S2XV61_9STRA|mmetsp:Transcript_12661/g.18651  ORF Transcript_12661/g.18651 Transcript_12661/m.18651 type:complete len:448 (+) Transcript_12661:103-1446(+)
MSFFVRQSKYRHVFCEPAAPQNTYTALRISTVTGEHNYIKGNTKFFAVSLQGGGGPVAVIPYTAYGRYDQNPPVISGHRGNVLDFEFNPFHEQIIATGSEDLTIKVWGIPEAGLTETIRDPLVDMHGHGKKVTLLRFHPAANNILASVAADYTVKIWDIEKGAEITSVQAPHSNLIHDIVWDYLGKSYFTSCKDKTVRCFDARSSEVTMEIPNAHEGMKSTKMANLGDSGRLATLGFTRQSGRQLKIWDCRNMGAELKTLEIDRAPGVMMPFYDPDSQLLFIAGKGDGNIRYFETVEESPFVYAINEFRTNNAAKGMGMVPKMGLNVSKNETARLLKMTSSTVEPLSFIVPRKSDAFQEDLFPETACGIPALSADEWVAGEDRPPVKGSLNPDLAGGNGPRQAAAATQQAFKPTRPAAEIQKELDAALARIEKLEAQLREAGLEPAT